MDLTERQAHELEYHKRYAEEHYEAFKNISFDILDPRKTRRWNAYWEMYRCLRSADLHGKDVLVVGCGAGHDAIRLAKLGANVQAFDLSPDLLKIGREVAFENKLSIHFRQMPAESLQYPDSTFDFIVAVDVLHHCELEATLRELRRVSKLGAVWVVNEIYTHSAVQRIRNSAFIEKKLYPIIARIIYQGKPYITDDERKLDQSDLRSLKKFMHAQQIRFFYVLVKRIFPDERLFAKFDKALLSAIKPLAPLLAGRFVAVGTVVK